MSWLDHFRGSLENPSTPLSSGADWLFDALGARKSWAGANITNDGSLALTAVYACVQIIATTLATLPLPVYKRLDNGGKQRAPSHPLYTLLHDRPNPEMSIVTFRETLMTNVLLWGNGFAEIERNQANQPAALWPIHPQRVRIANEGGRKVFWITVDGVEKPFGRDDILHIPGLGYDGFVGLSPIQLARQALGLASASEEFGARFFSNGAKMSGVLQHPMRLSDDAAKRLREGFEKVYGGAENAHKVFIAEEGMTFSPMSVPPNDAQFLETRKFQTQEIARIFRVPPHMLADLERATFSNIEHQSIDFVIHTIRPWAVRWEQTLNWELFGNRSPFYCEFVIDGLLRGDVKSRFEAYAVARQNGWLSANDIRLLENMNPVDGGDAYLVQTNMVPADRLNEVVDKQVAPDPAPQPPANSGGAADE